MMENKLNRTSLSEQVAAELENRFKKDQYAAGAVLPSEPQLMQQFSVSRTVIREALKTLQAKGLVETRHGKGTVFLGYDVADSPYNIFRNRYYEADSVELDQAFQTGAVIFTYTVKLALKNSAPNDLQKLRSITAQMKNTSDQKQLNDLYFKFMLNLSQIGKNPLNISLMRTLMEYFKFANQILLTAFDDTGFMAAHAEAVVDALEAGDEQKVLAEYRQLQEMNRAMLNRLIRHPSQDNLRRDPATLGAS